MAPFTGQSARAAGRAVSLRVALGIALVMPRPAATDDRFTVADPGVAESSGLTASLLNPDLFWTINDSGDDPLLYAVGPAGEARGRWFVPDVVHHDWEDLAAIRTPGGGAMLVIADTGDNTLARDNAALILVPEPVLTGAEPVDAETPTLTAPAIRVPLIFPDGPRNVEALLAHPFSGEILLVEKTNAAVAAVYRLPTPVLPDAPVLLERVGEIGNQGLGPLRQVTAGAVASDGSRFMLLRYGGVREWRLAAGQTMVDALASPGEPLAGPGIGRWEGAAYAADSGTAWFSAEGRPAPLASAESLP